MSDSLRPWVWTVAHQALLSTGFSKQEYWSGLLCPSPREKDPKIEPVPWVHSPPKDRTRVSCLLHWQAGSLPLAPPGNHPLHAAICVFGCVGGFPCSSLVKDPSPGQRLQLGTYVHGGQRYDIWLFACISHFCLFCIGI